MNVWDFGSLDGILYKVHMLYVANRFVVVKQG